MINSLFHKSRIFFGIRFCSGHRQKSTTVTGVKFYYEVLELPFDSDQDAVRSKYVELAKKYHPDSGGDSANVEKFHLVERAYRQLQKKFFEEDQEPHQETILDEAEGGHPDIKHTAPQHRQYLSHEGIGFGTPSQREKQYQKFRARRASEAVYEHRIGKISAQFEDQLVVKDRKETKKHHTKSAIERLVEDLIQESMAKGEFDNLPGKGKPLPERADYNPFQDFTTNKMNQILVEEGFAPEWITLQKEIRAQISDLRAKIKKKLEMNRFDMNQKDWLNFIEKIREEDIKTINKNVDEFNLIVPMLHGQMFHFNLDREISAALRIAKPLEQHAPSPPSPPPPLDNKKLIQRLLEKFHLLFKKSAS